MREFNRLKILAIIEIAFVLVVASAMFIYGVGKYVQFDNAVILDKTISQLSGMELMWAFYGYSKLFAILLGILEITGGVLLLIPRTRILGGLWIAAILLQIILQDIIYEVNTGALRAAILYFIMTSFVLWRYRTKLKQGLEVLLVKKERDGMKNRNWFFWVAAIVLFGLLKYAEYVWTH